MLFLEAEAGAVPYYLHMTVSMFLRYILSSRLVVRLLLTYVCKYKYLKVLYVRVVEYVKLLIINMIECWYYVVATI